MNAKKTIGGVPEKQKPKKARTASQQILIKQKTQKITTKLIWFIHGSVKPHPIAKTYREVPKQEYKHCDFDKLVFFGPNGSYAAFNQYNAYNFGELACRNRISDRFAKPASKDGSIMLRDMEFSVEPKTDPESFRQGMSVYLCKNGKQEKIIDYKSLIKLGHINMQQLINKSNEIMRGLGYGFKQWNLLLACCRVYAPSVKVNAEGEYVIDKYARYHLVQASFPENPELTSSTRREMLTGVSRESKTHRDFMRGQTIRNPKVTKGEIARRKTRITERKRLPIISEDDRMSVSTESSKSRSRSISSRQFSENEFYKMLVVD